MTEIRIPYVPRPWQAECHRNLKRFSVLAIHRRGGKTQLALMELLDKAAKFEKELGVFIYLAPLLKQAENVVWKRLKRLVQPLLLAGLLDIRESDLEISFRHNGASIRLFGANNPEELRGVGIDGIVIDEVAQIDPVVWDEIIQPTLADRLGWALFIGTPKGINLFSELFFAGQEDPDWHAARYTVYETNSLDPAEVERRRKKMTQNAFAREFLCDFSASGDEQVISLLDVEDAAGRQLREGDYYRMPRVMGVDPARFGSDRSVIFKRQGLVAFEPIVFQGMDNMTLATRVAAEIEKWEPETVFVDAGAGAGVIDRLRQLGYSVVEVPFGGKAMSGEFYNRRTEMWFLMADWIRSGGCIPNRTSLKQELATPIYWYDGDQKRLESKDQIKKRLSAATSPDEADALALTFAAPVAQVSPLEQYERELAMTQDHLRYDPFSPEAMTRRRERRNR